MEICGDSAFLENMYHLKIMINIIRYTIVILLCIKFISDYVRSSENKEDTKEVINIFYKKMIIIVLLIFIPVIMQIISITFDKPKIYNCLWKVTKEDISNQQKVEQNY